MIRPAVPAVNGDGRTRKGEEMGKYMITSAHTHVKVTVVLPEPYPVERGFFTKSDVAVKGFKVLYVDGSRTTEMIDCDAYKLKKDGTPGLTPTRHTYYGAADHSDWIKPILAELDARYAGRTVEPAPPCTCGAYGLAEDCPLHNQEAIDRARLARYDAEVAHLGNELGQEEIRWNEESPIMRAARLIREQRNYQMSHAASFRLVDE